MLQAKLKDPTRASNRAIWIIVTAWGAAIVGIVGLAGWGLWQVGKLILRGLGWGGA
jgi:hypothetical protein